MEALTSEDLSSDSSLTTLPWEKSSQGGGGARPQRRHPNQPGRLGCSGKIK